MGRIRSIKPEAFRSPTLSTVPVAARWTFAGLWTYVDDAGRGLYNPRLIWSDLYPLDIDTTPDDVEIHLKALVDIGAIEIYEANGKTYFWIPAWEEHQSASFRRGESRLPAPPARGCMQESASSMPMSAGGEGKRKGEEQGKGTGSGDANSPELPPVFAEFCDAYPDQVQTRPALNAWTQAVKRTNGHAERIIEGAKRYAAWLDAQGSRAPFTRSAVKWLNEDGWLDTLKPVNGRASPSTTDQRVTDAIAVAQRLDAQESTPHRKAIGR